MGTPTSYHIYIQPILLLLRSCAYRSRLLFQITYAHTNTRTHKHIQHIHRKCQKETERRLIKKPSEKGKGLHAMPNMPPRPLNRENVAPALLVLRTITPNKTRTPALPVVFVLFARRTRISWRKKHLVVDTSSSPLRPDANEFVRYQASSKRYPPPSNGSGISHTRVHSWPTATSYAVRLSLAATASARASS